MCDHTYIQILSNINDINKMKLNYFNVKNFSIIWLTQLIYSASVEKEKKKP